MTGTITKLERDRGFGFIRDERGREVFFHTSAVRDVRFEDLKEGQRVVLEAIDAAKGPRAEIVRLLPP